MKILGIVGSKRMGNSYAMVNAAVAGLENCEVELVHLNKDFNLCDGCLICDEKGKCKFEDYVSPLVEKVSNSDGFIFASPARWGLLSGELKSFFDRLNPLAVPQKLKGKKAIIFTVGQCEGEEAESIKLAAETIRYFCDNAGIEVVDIVIAEGCMNSNDVINNNPQILDICKEKTLKLLDSLK